MLALAGRQTVYTTSFASTANAYTDVWSAVAGEARAWQVGRFTRDSYGTGDVVVGVAGDGATLVYGIAELGATRCQPEDVTCSFAVIRGGVRRVVGRVVTEIPGIPPPALLAVSTGRIAVAPADMSEQEALTAPTPKPVAGGAVEIRNAATGQLISSFAPDGTVRAVAMSAHRVVVLVARGRGKRIEGYAISDGTRLWSQRVPPGVSRDLDLSAFAGVYRAGLRLYRFDSRSGRTKNLALATSRPVGLSIERRRVVWGENMLAGRDQRTGAPRYRSRVRSVVIP